MAARVVDVYADVGCPFAHASLRLVVDARDERGADVRFRVRSWPVSLTGTGIEPEIAALRSRVVPDLFSRFDPGRFPSSTRAALLAEQAAYRESAEAGERFSLAVRDALFERGLDVSDWAVLASLGAPSFSAADEAAVDADRVTGDRRGVRGSPHYFTPEGSDFFCPMFDIAHEGGGSGVEVRFDAEERERFLAVVLRP